MPVRRQVLAALGTATLAGCSLPQRVASRDQRATLREATAPVPDVGWELVVSDAHLREARETFRAFRRRLADREDQLDADYVKPVQATPDGSRWERVEAYRRWTRVVASRYADLFSDRYDRDSVRARLAPLEGAEVAYVGGTPTDAIAQLAVADRRLLEVSDAVERASAELVRDLGHAFTQAWRATLAVRDARHLASALPDGPSHAGTFRDAYDRHRSALVTARERDHVFGQFYDSHFEELVDVGPGDVMLSVGADAREAGRLARALRFVLLGRLAHAGQRRLTARLERLEPRPDERVAPEHVATAGTTAHETLRQAIETGTPLTRSLCRPLTLALRRTDERVADLADGNVRYLYENGGLDQRALRPPLLSYLAIGTMADRAMGLDEVA